MVETRHPTVSSPTGDQSGPLQPVRIEVCVEGVESALAAREGGADRVELCANLAVGGITPSAGTIAVACRRLSIPVHVLIRPRCGDFLYTEPEFEVMAHDIEVARSLGASGVVLGLLTEDRTIDRIRTARLVTVARPLNVTFHKAFDSTRDPFEALETLMDLGVNLVLTSGQSPTAREGIRLLADLVRRANGRVRVVAGGRITEADIGPLRDAGLREIHVGSAASDGSKTSAARTRRMLEIARSATHDF